MNLHEYQAKQLFSQYGLPINRGIACHSIEETEQALSQLSGDIFAVKCQIHAGGRGKAGGVKLVKNAEQARQFAEQWLGKKMVTFQTNSRGLPVNTIYVEETCEIERELYLGAVIDRSSQKVVFMASSAGGMDIEEIAKNTPELIHKISIDSLTNAQPFQARELAFKLGLKGTEIQQFVTIFLQLAKLFLEKDLALLEVNPLVVTKQQNLICLDAKAVIDNNALYRHPELKALEDETQEDPREAYASQWELNYVALNGNIGCMVNGAGLAMGTCEFP